MAKGRRNLTNLGTDQVEVAVAAAASGAAFNVWTAVPSMPHSTTLVTTRMDGMSFA